MQVHRTDFGLGPDAAAALRAALERLAEHPDSAPAGARTAPVW